MAPATNRDIPALFASLLVYILRGIMGTSLIGIILLHFIPSTKEHIRWVVPIYSFLFIHRLITYVSQ